METRLYPLVAALIFLPSLQSSAQSDTWALNANRSQTGFEVRHMGISNIHGTLGSVSGTVVWDKKNVSRSSVDVVIDTTTINATKMRMF